MNINNQSSSSVENNTNLKQQYFNLKQKIADLQKQNLEMIEIYKAEEERLTKSNEFLMNKNNHEHSRTIQELESEVLNMRKSIQQLNKIIEQKNASNPNLIENDDLINNSNNNNILNNSMEKIAKEEYLKNYKNKLITEFEKKLTDKHKEIIDFYIEQNKKIKESKGKDEDIVNIDEIKFFTLKEKPKEKLLEQKKNNGLEELIKNINENDSNEIKEINIENINKIISLLCLKEEYPKDFFIDYILDESYSGTMNKRPNLENILETDKDGHQQINDSKKVVPKRPVRKSVFNVPVGISGNKIANKICTLFDIKYETDKEIIKSYINKIMLINIHNPRRFFEKNLEKYRFAPYEQHEKENYDKIIKKVFEREISRFQNLLNYDNNIINLDLFEQFIKKYYYSNDVNDDLIYYMMSLMKLTKKERKEEKDKRIKSLGLFEFYFLPLFQKVNY